MQYFSIPTIRDAIERLQNVSANWLLPAFVFAANDVGKDELTDMSKRLGTDQFLDRYFNGELLGIPPFPSGNNLLRPRLKGIKWNRGEFANDHIIRQDTKMWGNLFSSRGYREMRQRGEIEGEKAVIRLTNAFQGSFEDKVPEDFRFEDLLIWLFALDRFPDEVNGWEQLEQHFLRDHLELDEFQPDYRGRFRLTNPPIPWPDTTDARPTNDEFLRELAPRLLAFLSTPYEGGGQDDKEPGLGDDDEVYAAVTAAINKRESYAFLLAGPPGTGKTRYARRLANKLTENDKERMLFLQFHPAIGYDDFMEGFRPESNAAGDSILYKLDARLFLKFAQEAESQPEKLYVAIIDELNRGDVARVFGEVLTYLEPDYRGTDFTLPFSEKLARLPKNLILIATANPYDRSVTDLDDALLRRFWVVELDPDGALLKSHLQDKGVEDGVVNRAVQMFTVLNDRMPHGYGHTSFLKVQSVDDLAAVWIGRARLALRRAFMHDPTTFDTTVAEIEQLLETRDDEDGEQGAGAGGPE